MSRTLCLLRHAKSSWEDASVADQDRPLNARGRRDAPRMGKALAGRLEPMPVHVSPALRAQLTLGGLQEGWPALREQPHRTSAALYTFSVDELVGYLRSVDDELQTLLLIGHNPGLTDLVNWVCDRPALDHLPTAGFAQLDLTIGHWADLQRGCGRLAGHLFPKEIKP